MQPEFASALEQLNPQERAIILYLCGRGRREDVGSLSDAELKALTRQALGSLAANLGVDSFEEDAFAQVESGVERPDLFSIRRSRYSKKRSPFVEDGCSVFADLTLPQVCLVISRLPLADQFLVLTYLGYFPFEGQQRLAEELGYASKSSLDRRKSIGYLSKTLEEAVDYVQISRELSSETPSLQQLLVRVQEARENGELRRTKERLIGGWMPKSPSQESLASLDLSNLTNAEIYRRLTPSQRKIFDLITERVPDDGRFVWSVTTLAQALGMGRKNLSGQLKAMVSIFQEKRLVRWTKLRQRATKLTDHPKFLAFLNALPERERRAISLFLGVPSSDGEMGESSFPQSVADTARLLSSGRSTVHKQITRAVKQLEKQLQMG